MKQIVEEAAMKELNSNSSYAIIVDGELSYQRQAMLNMFRKGAQWQAKQSPWISVKERLPEDNELVLTSSGIYGTKLLMWNDHYRVWDDEDGDDVYCERDKIDAWMPIPE